ncbi:MAG: hypothetical protein AAF799_17510 [Myxococcota bacterium]
MASTLNAFLDRYRRAFAANDVAGLVELVHLPCLVMGPTVHALTTPEELEQSLARQLERHQQAGVVEARFEVLGHRRLEARTLTADVGWQMRDAEDGIVADFALMYTLTAPERGWKIVAVAPLELGLLAANPTGAHTIPDSVFQQR